jgi:hypothetical protein
MLAGLSLMGDYDDGPSSAKHSKTPPGTGTVPVCVQLYLQCCTTGTVDLETAIAARMSDSHATPASSYIFESSVAISR